MEIKQKSSCNSMKKKSGFEFCKVCNLNHDQGPRHKYFPNHKKSLSTFLFRFQKKISDIRFFLKNPTALRPEHASQNRFWCVFCDTDIDELGSSFACANAINHLASASHLKNLKHFLWKHGGPNDQLDAFRILDADVAKWQKKCMALKDEAAFLSKGWCGRVAEPSTDIHNNQLNYENIVNFENACSHSLESYPSNGVLPMQCFTSECQVSYSGISGVGNAGLLNHNGALSIPAETCSGKNSFELKDFGVDRSCHSLPCNGRQCSSNGYYGNKVVYENGRMVNNEGSYQALQILTRVSSEPSAIEGGNVHSGAPPPWLEAIEGIQMQAKSISGDFVSHPNKSGNSKRLNPKRVGAAWAEKRKIELEMEKRGETVGNEHDVNWLPNFGRVWQPGSRKESRKEFEREKQKLFKVETRSEMPIKIKPYVSKRMRLDTDDDHASG